MLTDLFGGQAVLRCRRRSYCWTGVWALMSTTASSTSLDWSTNQKRQGSACPMRVSYHNGFYHVQSYTMRECCICVGAEVQTMMYLKISLSDFLTVFAARTRKPFFSRRPGNLLMVAACFAMGVSTLFSLFWPTFLPELQPLQGREAAVVSHSYCVVSLVRN